MPDSFKKLAQTQPGTSAAIGITIQAASTGLTVGVQSTTPTDTVPFIVFNTIIKAS